MSRMPTFTRAANFTLAAVTVAALAACAPVREPSEGPASPHAPATSAPVVDDGTGPAFAHTTPLSIDEFEARMMAYLAERGRGDLGAQSVCDEYAEAVAIWPLPLPEGYAFPLPVASGIRAVDAQGFSCEDQPDMKYMAGFGLTSAFFFWSGATATAAVADHQRGDERAAAEHLDELEAGNLSGIGYLFMEEAMPADGSPLEEPEPESPMPDYSPTQEARNGNYAPVEEEASMFLRDPVNASIAASAGDHR